MDMKDTALMVRLLGRLKKEMNGAVTQAMEQRGVHYPLNYGVSVPTIQHIAKEYAPNHSLATLLYKQQVRELKLAAAYMDDPAAVTPDQMRQWSVDFTHSELVEQVVYALFRHAPDALPMALEWLDASDSMHCYAGLLMTVSVVRSGHCVAEDLHALFDRVDRLARSSTLDRAVVRGVVTSLVELAQASSAIRHTLSERIPLYKNSATDLVDELTWQLEYRP